MTIAELMAVLAQYPPELRVLVESYESGYDEVQRLDRRICVQQSARPWWEGPWQEAPSGEACLLLTGSRRQAMEPRPSPSEPA